MTTFRDSFARPSGNRGSAADRALPPPRLGRFQLVDDIAVGGMARVHLARITGIGGFEKWVAVKQIHRHLAADDRFIRMFLDEARVAASVAHPNVAQVFDVGRDGEDYWMAMEYLHGEALVDLMPIWSSTAPESSTAAESSIAIGAKIVADAADGLHAAHELRDPAGRPLDLIHRDVTPHNIILTYDGVVKLVDFGVAKMAGQLAMTAAGTLKGKLAYMSPEQVQGVALDRRTDVFALGVVLWELTVGRRLFRAERDMETLSRILTHEAPRPSDLIAGFPLHLETIVLRALEKNRSRRFNTARDFSRALNEFLVTAGASVGASEIGAMVRRSVPARHRAREERLLRAAKLVGERAQISVAAHHATNAAPDDGSSLSLMFDYSEGDDDAVTWLVPRSEQPLRDLRLPPPPVLPARPIAAARAAPAAFPCTTPLLAASEALAHDPAPVARGRTNLTTACIAAAVTWLAIGAVALGALHAKQPQTRGSGPRPVVRPARSAVADRVSSTLSDAEPPAATASRGSLPAPAARAPKSGSGANRPAAADGRPGF